MPDRNIKTLAQDFHLNPEQVRELIRLLEQNYGAPYILRYRKDLAANLTEDDIAVLRRFSHELNILETERKKILKKIRENGAGNEELEQQIESAENINELYDYYVPYRPRKRSKSRLAQSQGLATLARQIVEHELDHTDLVDGAEEYINPEVELNNAGEVIEGVAHIIKDWMAEEKSHRDMQRGIMEKKARLVAQKSGKWNKRDHDEFREFDRFNKNISDVHPHQMLCLMRGKRVNSLRYRIEAPIEEMHLQAAELYLEGGEDEFYEIDSIFHDQKSLHEGEGPDKLTGPQLLYWCIRESIARTLAPVLSKEKEADLRRRAEDHALDIARRKLRSQLMTPPVEQSKVMGIDPGFRTGCKLAVLDENGELLDSDTVYPHTPKNQWEDAKKVIQKMVAEHEVSVVCLGDNNGSRETERLLSEIIGEQCPDLSYTMAKSVPAELQFKSSSAKLEMPKGTPKKMYKAVALGRQTLRPLEELTKIPLYNLCESPFQKEINKKALDDELNHVAEECVGETGPDVNSSPVTLIKYVPGLDYNSALKIKNWRDEHGPFSNRRELRQLPDISIEMWYKAAPFIRVSNSDNPLDHTRIHPDHYRVAEAILSQLQLSIEDLENDAKREEIEARKGEVDFAALEEQYEMHYLYLKEIINELITPWPDPRREFPPRMLRQGTLNFDQIEPLQMLQGTVQKIVGFGAFVDIGLGEDGLVHISELSDEFVESPYDIAYVGEQVTVWVVDVDPDNKRIALSMRSKEAAEKAADKRQKIKEKKETRQRIAEKKKEAHSRVPVADLPASMQQAKSTVGQQSQRMKKIKEFSERKAKRGSDGQQEGKKDKHEDDRTKIQMDDEAQSGNLLDRLRFASIEKRGKEK